MLGNDPVWVAENVIYSIGKMDPGPAHWTRNVTDVVWSTAVSIQCVSHLEQAATHIARAAAGGV